jgi:glycosyltransferase involved in cell wall biosynthesis
MTNNLNVIVAIVNWNGWKDTIDCLQSLLNCNHEGHLYIVVCDNASANDSVTHIRNWLATQNYSENHNIASANSIGNQLETSVWGYEVSDSCTVEIIQHHENSGYAGGNNVALRYALGRYNIDYAWILNNDTEITKDALIHMLVRMQESPSIGICGATLLYQEQPDFVQAYGGVKYSKCTGRGVHLGGGDKYSGEVNQRWVEENLSYISGACMLVSRSFLNDIGLMHENYFLYNEELDWAQRAKGRYQLGYASKSLIYHKEGASIGTVSKDHRASLISEFYQARNKLWFTKNYFTYCLPSVWGVMLLQALKRFVLRQPENGWVMLKVLFGQVKPDPTWTARRGTKVDVKVAVIEPVGSHGGMDYYDSGLCAGLGANNVASIWYTCDTSDTRGERPIIIVRSFTNIWGKDAAWKRGLRFVAGLFRSMTDAHSRQANIAHFHFFHVGPLEVAGIVIARLFGLRVITTVHDVEAFKPGGKSPLLQRIAYGLCSRLVVHNQVSRDELIARSGVSESMVRVVPHGSYLGLIPPSIDRHIARDKLGFPQDERIVLFFGQIKEVKGLDLLIEAFAKVRDQVGSTRLVIAGKVWKDDFSRYQDLIDRYALADVVSLHIRYIPDDEIATYYSAADIVALPYRKIYQSGVLLMAMSYGIPVLASDLPGMSEVITDGENGFLFKTGDADDLANRLAAVLTDTQGQERAVTQARKDMELRYSWDTIGGQLAEVYREVLN